eukprot:02317.XXX_27565_27669_1 [CDS] Oithona nana genome sequencing.
MSLTPEGSPIEVPLADFFLANDDEDLFPFPIVFF